ncbi:hypothetical protein ACF1FX_32625 [Streptomyces sp. NPDC014646]|uniref:hypothetical protein n=1 Tax=Streptomyces sp. NPDC014646 TaxID=3364877 RepID=UPI0036FEAAA2
MGHSGDDRMVAVGAASGALATVDALVDALAQLGPEAKDALAPALAATATVRRMLTGPETAQEQSRPDEIAGLAAAPERRHTTPDFWLHRDMRVAEQLWWGTWKAGAENLPTSSPPCRPKP